MLFESDVCMGSREIHSRLDLCGIKRSAVSTERIGMIRVISKKARPGNDVISDKSDIQHIACARYTPRTLTATALYFDRT